MAKTRQNDQALPTRLTDFPEVREAAKAVDAMTHLRGLLAEETAFRDQYRGVQEPA